MLAKTPNSNENADGSARRSVPAIVVLLAAACVLAAWSGPENCLAQSGSRSAAPPARSVFSPRPQLEPQFPQASQPLLQPNFGTSVIDQGIQQNAFAQGVRFQNTPGENYSFEQSMPIQSSPGQTAGSSSFGIPESSVVDPIFEINDPNSTIRVDHSIWDGFLGKYVSPDFQGLNRVYYGNVSYEDFESLRYYLQQLQSIDLRTLNRNEQLAYWFNLYNARTLAIVLENYPIRSIRQIKQKLTDFVGPFDDEGAVNVLGKSLSLNDIESGIIRPIYNDPRIHYALNCASYGCPNLSSRAWHSHDLDARLNAAASDFINSGRGVKSSICGTKVSKIYKWYAGDFGGEEGVLKHMRQYANHETLRTLNRSNNIGGYFYDWSLNDAKIQRRRIFEQFIR